MMRVRRRAGDEGFSLVELSVVVMIFGILSAMVGATLINAMGGTRRTQERTYRSADVQKTLELISKDVRVALPVIAAAANDLTVNVYRNGVCQQRRWYLDTTAKTLVETTANYPASASCVKVAGTPGAPTTRTLLRNVDTTLPLFTYFRLSSTGVKTQITALPASAADRKKLQAVFVDIRVAGPEGGRAINMKTSVELRNV